MTAVHCGVWEGPVRAGEEPAPLPWPREKTSTMYIYFCGSIRGGREDVGIYQKLVKKLQEHGEVLTEHVSNSGHTEKGAYAAMVGEKLIHDRDMEWLQQADLIVAETTQTSLGVGYEIGRAVAMEKRILVLFRPSCGRSLSALIRGAENGDLFQVRDYEEVEAEVMLDSYFASLDKSGES